MGARAQNLALFKGMASSGLTNGAILFLDVNNNLTYSDNFVFDDVTGQFFVETTSDITLRSDTGVIEITSFISDIQITSTLGNLSLTGNQLTLDSNAILAPNLPTSTAGLATGSLWCDTTGGLNIVKQVL